MPHVYANDEHDLYFAVEFDMFNSSLDMVNKSKRLLSNTDETIVKCLQAFADGVNEFFRESLGKNLLYIKWYKVRLSLYLFPWLS